MCGRTCVPALVRHYSGNSGHAARRGGRNARHPICSLSERYGLPFLTTVRTTIVLAQTLAPRNIGKSSTVPGSQ